MKQRNISGEIRNLNRWHFYLAGGQKFSTWASSLYQATRNLKAGGHKVKDIEKTVYLSNGVEIESRKKYAEIEVTPITDGPIWSKDPFYSYDANEVMAIMDIDQDDYSSLIVRGILQQNSKGGYSRPQIEEAMRKL